MHSFISCLVHCVFSTQGRQPMLTAEVRERLWPYLGGIARENGITVLAVGGVADHVRILLSLPATMSVAKAMQLLKGNSSKWLHESFPKLRNLAWQEGYGAFSIGAAGIEETVAYIRNQEEHHRHRSFREEVELFLKRHGMDAGGVLESRFCRPCGTLRLFSFDANPALKRWAIFGVARRCAKAMGCALAKESA